MFSQVRIFPISGYATDGKPIISTGYPLLAKAANEQEVNNISIALTKVEQSKPYRADNKVEIDSIVESWEGTITAYGVGSEALAVSTENLLDDNGNLIYTQGKDGSPKVVIFYRGRDPKGKEYNVWIFNAEISTPDPAANQEQDTPESVSLPFTASAITYGGNSIFFAKVEEGKTGYIADGVEPTASDLYMPVISA